MFAELSMILLLCIGKGHIVHFEIIEKISVQYVSVQIYSVFAKQITYISLFCLQDSHFINHATFVTFVYNIIWFTEDDLYL